MVIGDNGYDTDAVLDLIETAGARAEIPSKSKRNPPRPRDREICRMRSLIERHFGKIRESCRSTIWKFRSALTEPRWPTDSGCVI